MKRQISIPVFKLCTRGQVNFFSNPSKTGRGEESGNMSSCSWESQFSERVLSRTLLLLCYRGGDWGIPVTDRFTLGRTRAVSSMPRVLQHTHHKAGATHTHTHRVTSVQLQMYCMSGRDNLLQPCRGRYSRCKQCERYVAVIGRLNGRRNVAGKTQM